MRKFSSFLCGFLLFLTAVSLAVTLTLHCRPLYYHDIKALDIPEQSGLSEESVRENYDALIDYNSFFSADELFLPSLPVSQEGRIHFAEVKTIFLYIKAFALFGVLFSVGGIFLLRRTRPDFFLWAAGFSVGIPAVVGGMISVDWTGTFLLMHRLLFRNLYWGFDPVSDPVILILPSEFFMHCGIMIIALVALSAVAEILLWRFWTKKRKPEGKPHPEKPGKEEKQPALRV